MAPEDNLVAANTAAFTMTISNKSN
jgi:hypothetical protein